MQLTNMLCSCPWSLLLLRQNEPDFPAGLLDMGQGGRVLAAGLRIDKYIFHRDSRFNTVHLSVGSTFWVLKVFSRQHQVHALLWCHQNSWWGMKKEPDTGLLVSMHSCTHSSTAWHVSRLVWDKTDEDPMVGSRYHYWQRMVSNLLMDGYNKIK
jgi:hypothetical protein